MALRRRKRAAVLIISNILMDDDHEERRRRSCWVKPWILRRKELGYTENLLKELKLEDKDSYRKFMRIDTVCFTKLLNMVKTRIAKSDTSMRESISAEERLSVTLRHLATGETFSSLHFQFRLGVSTIYYIVYETCDAIYDCLRKSYLKVPKDEAEWIKIADDFWSSWQYPHCIGAIDGKHISVFAPPNFGSYYFNYKSYFSVILLAVVDANLKAIFVDVGTNGRVHDTAVFSKSALGKQLEQKRVPLPPPELLPGQGVPTNYVIVGDEGFPLKPYLMRPYSLKAIANEHEIYNKRHTRARRVSENFFGVLVHRFRIFLRPIQALPQNVVKLVLATCSLHNFLRENSANYVGKERAIPTTKTMHGLANLGNHNSQAARETRENLNRYFNTNGANDLQNVLKN